MVSGGLTAELTGGNFWQGAEQGYIVAALNHVLHQAVEGDGGGDDPPSKMDQIGAELEAMKQRIGAMKEQLLSGFSDGATYASSAFDGGGLNKNKIFAEGNKYLKKIV